MFDERLCQRNRRNRQRCRELAFGRTVLSKIVLRVLSIRPIALVQPSSSPPPTFSDSRLLPRKSYGVRPGLRFQSMRADEPWHAVEKKNSRTVTRIASSAGQPPRAVSRTSKRDLNHIAGPSDAKGLAVPGTRKIIPNADLLGGPETEHQADCMRQG